MDHDHSDDDHHQLIGHRAVDWCSPLGKDHLEEKCSLVGRMIINVHLSHKEVLVMIIILVTERMIIFIILVTDV